MYSVKIDVFRNSDAPPYQQRPNMGEGEDARCPGNGPEGPRTNLVLLLCLCNPLKELLTLRLRVFPKADAKVRTYRQNTKTFRNFFQKNCNVFHFLDKITLLQGQKRDFQNIFSIFSTGTTYSIIIVSDKGKYRQK